MLSDNDLKLLVNEKIGNGRTLLQLTEQILGKKMDGNNIHHSSLYGRIYDILMSGRYSFYPITKDRDTPFWVRGKGATKCLFPEDWFNVYTKHNIKLVDGECETCRSDKG